MLLTRRLLKFLVPLLLLSMVLTACPAAAPAPAEEAAPAESATEEPAGE